MDLTAQGSHPTTGELIWDGRTQAEAYNVAGASGYISVPVNESLKPESITMEGWFQFSDLTTWPYQREIFREQGIRSFVLADQTYRTDISLGTETIRLYHDGRAEVGRWTHVAVAYDADTGTGSLFIDGQLVDSASFSTPRPLDTTPGVTNVGVGYPTFASIDNYRVWNYARSESEIAEGLTRHYQDEEALVLDYRFEDGQNDRSVHDHSMYGNTGYRVSNGGETQIGAGLADVGTQMFSILVEDGRGGSDVQTFALEVMPELRGRITGHLFEDLNGDGDQDDGSEEGVPEEPNLEGWHLWIDSNGNAFPDPHEAQVTTDADGNYEFAGLLPGAYPVKVSPVAGYTTPNDFTATVEPEIVRELEAAAATNYDLAIEQLSLGQIRGQLLTEDAEAIAYWKVFADLDDDGAHGENEPLAITDRNGDYALTGLAAGTYKIRTELPAGWADTAGRDGLTVTLTDDEISAGNDFALEPTNTSVTGGVHFVTMPITTIEARQTFRYSAVAMGVANGEITYDLSLAPEGMTVDPNTGFTAWRPSIDQVGEHLVILRATSASGSISLHDFNLQVTAPNTPPVIVAPAASAVGSNAGEPQGASRGFFNAYVGITYALNVIAQDAESTDLAFSLTQSPSNAIIDPATGRLSWTPAASAVGSQEFTVEVTDEHGASTSATWTVEVTGETPAILPLKVNLPRNDRSSHGRVLQSGRRDGSTGASCKLVARKWTCWLDRRGRWNAPLDARRSSSWVTDCRVNCHDRRRRYRVGILRHRSRGSIAQCNSLDRLHTDHFRLARSDVRVRRVGLRHGSRHLRVYTARRPGRHECPSIAGDDPLDARHRSTRRTRCADPSQRSLGRY